MGSRTQVVEIFAPVEGRKHDAPPTMIDFRSQPDGSNNKLKDGYNRKEYGTSVFCTGTSTGTSVLGAPITLGVHARFPSAGVLEVFTNTGVFKYTSGGDAFVSDGQVFTGGATDYWSVVMYNDAMIYNNGSDLMQYKPTLSATGTQMTSAVATNTYKAWCLLGVREHLCLYHTVENGTEFYKRVRWTKKGTLSYSAGTTDFASGTYGAVDLPDAEGEIKHAYPLAEGIAAVLAEKSIHLQTYVGGDEVYQFYKTISGIGTPSRRGGTSYEGVVYFIGHDNFYEYRGGDDIRPIGDPIRTAAYSEIYRGQLKTSYVSVDPQDDEIHFHVPVATDTSPSVVWVYNRGNKTWARQERAYTSHFSFNNQAGITIGELVGNIGAQNLPYSAYFVGTNSDIFLYGDASGRVAKKNQAVHSLYITGSTLPQNFGYATPDIVGITEQGKKARDPLGKNEVNFTNTIKRYEEFSFEAYGTGSAYVSYSTNEGRSYTTLPGNPIALVAEGSVHVVDCDHAAPKSRFMVTQTGTNDSIFINYARVKFIVSGEDSP